MARPRHFEPHRPVRPALQLQRVIGNQAMLRVHEALRSPGRGLDPSTRAFMESRFGHDFGRVRVHTDAKAAESAQAVNALAYTLGRDVVFGEGAYAPGTARGRRLLAHELAHVVQQPQAGRQAPLGIAAPSSEMESEAERAGQVLDRGLKPHIQPRIGDPQTIARYVPAEPEPELAPPETESPPFAVPPDPGSFEGMEQANEVARILQEHEQPMATLERGGKAPDFVTKKGQGVVATRFANVRYDIRAFHVLDAMEDDVDNAASSGELVAIYRSYFPDSILGGARGGGTILDRVDPTFYPKMIDAGGKVRARVFRAAVQNKIKENSALSTKDLVDAISQELAARETESRQEALRKEQEVQGPCEAGDVDRKGGNEAHNEYATRVTGSTRDYRIVTPSGLECVTDGRDSKSRYLVWEVKTQHEWATKQGIIDAIFAPRKQGQILDLDEQVNRCLTVCARCGFQYKVAFQSKDAAAFMHRQWGGVPPVVHRE